MSFIALSLISVVFLILSPVSYSGLQSFVYLGCSQLKYAPGSPYEPNVNSVLASLVNAASFSNFNNFKVSLSGSSQSDAAYGLFQCRGDISNSDCRDCVANAVSRLGSVCVGAAGGVMQYEGCFVKFDNYSFLGIPDKTVVYSKCGPAVGLELNRRDGVLDYLAGSGQYFRVGGSGDAQGMTQCTQDLTAGECQDCVSAAIQRLRNECISSAWADIFLVKCYARYSQRRHTATNSNDDEIEKTLAIIVGLIAGVAVLVVFLSCLSKFCDSNKGGK